MAIFGLASFFAQQIRTAEAEADRVYEAVIGIVVDIKDPEKQCRVKVRFPTLGPDSTWWCPVVALGAGADRGWFTLPEVDDEVVVGFEHGDLARPVVLGAIWNGKDRAPDTNADGDNPRRVIRSKRGHTVTLDDKDGAIRLADGEGIATVTIAASAGVTLEAAQGDVAIQCKDDLQILAGEIAITARGACELIGKSAGVDATGTAGVKVNGNLVALKGSTIDLNPGGVATAAKATGTVSEVPGSDPGSNRPAQVSPGGADDSATGDAPGGSAATTSATGGAPSTAPGPAAAEAAADDDLEPIPALLSATWSTTTARPGETVKLLAMCLDLSGQPATFTIRSAIDDSPAGTTRGTCGEAMVEATWTTPADGGAGTYTFTVEAGGQAAEAGLLTLVKPFAATLILDEVPAFGVEVELETVETGDRVRAIADSDGKVTIPEAAIGTWRLHLTSAEGA